MHVSLHLFSLMKNCFGPLISTFTKHTSSLLNLQKLKDFATKKKRNSMVLKSGKKKSKLRSRLLVLLSSESELVISFETKLWNKMMITRYSNKTHLPHTMERHNLWYTLSSRSTAVSQHFHLQLYSCEKVSVWSTRFQNKTLCLNFKWDLVKNPS